MENAQRSVQNESSSVTLKQSLFEKLLQQHLDAEIQVVEHVARDEAERSGLLGVLKPEIVSFLDYFLESHSWKRLYVTSRLGTLSEDFQTCSHDERRVKTMEFAGEMSQLVLSTFQDGTDGYRRAMSGLGRIVELLFSWQTDRTSSEIPKYRGTKADGDPVRFLQQNYSRWIASGRLTQISLREVDEKLLNSVKYELRKLGRPLADLVPPGIRR